MKTTFWKTLLALLLALLVICGLFSGCGRNTENPQESDAEDTVADAAPETTVDISSDKAITLHIVTEKIKDDKMSMNYVLSEVAKKYEKNHQEVNIQIEYLSDRVDERDIQLKRIRNEILAGDGPDLFILPDGSSKKGENPLFLDVELAMRNESFYDISAFYDADDALEKEQLNNTIMEAGVLDGVRYVLPLYYDIPVVLMNPEKAAASEIDTERLKSNVFDMMDTLLETEDPMWCSGAYMIYPNNFFGHDLFPDLMDYSSGEVILTAEEVAAYMQRVQKLHSYIGKLPEVKRTSFFQSTMLTYIGRGSIWYDSGFPIHVMNLNYAFEYAAIAKSNNWPLEMYPLRATDGSVIANVTYWGAVGAGSKHPDVAYDFLRLFLLKDVQWESIRMDGNKLANTEPWRLHLMDINVPWGLVTNGWPVRTGNSVEYIWRAYNKSLYSYDIEVKKEMERVRRLKDIAMWDDDFQILTVQIDKVRFSNKYETDLSSVLASLNDGANGFAPKDVDIDKLAEDAIWDLKYHLGEG